MENLEIARLRPLVDLLKEENNGVRKSFNNLQQRINKTIELTKNLLKTENKGYYQIIFKEILKSLGDKE